MLLEDLQEIDLQADGSQVRIQHALAEIEALDGRLLEVRESVAVKSADLEAIDAERQSLEENLATETANINRSEANLKGITTQKEYQAVNKEIASAKKLIQELEEQILQKITAIEELKGELAAMEADLAALEQNLAVQKDEIQARIASEEAAVAASAKARGERLKSIPPGITKRYEKLREGRRGIAIAEARNGGCMGCNMQLPPQMYNNLYKGEELITCPHCQRILVLKKPAEEQ
jgi:predicted  nucleic acid-binding Zn-ribbon protein